MRNLYEKNRNVFVFNDKDTIIYGPTNINKRPVLKEEYLSNPSI